jgi:mercuric ion transport protein
MNDSALIKTGIIGAVIAAVCCATPVLVIALGAVGLSALTGYLDYVLLPALALCIGMIAFGVFKRRQGAAGIVNKTTTGT